MAWRSYEAYGEEFPFQDSEYADDTAIIYKIRYDLEIGRPFIINKSFCAFWNGGLFGTSSTM